MDTRALFFLAAAGLCLLLVPVAEGHAWVAATVSGVYLVLAAASWLDWRSRQRR
ncbi:MAG TPA: hypothetical protein VK306_06270 [Acidimicrobiales bacterium]|nr:hypothetical protein [Acidimicrobiales bacterium]